MSDDSTEYGPCRCCKANEDDVSEIRPATGPDGFCDRCRQEEGPL